MLNINEIFGPTIQGEGKLSGVPSVFIRFAKCNFSCAGFKVEYKTSNGERKFGCDTYYAVDKEFKDTWKKYETSQDIINEVENSTKLSTYPYKLDIVITGGEPLLYWKDKQFQKLLQYYTSQNHKITIETNASLDIAFTKTYQKDILFSMGVKLSNTLEKYEKRVNKKAINTILQNCPTSYIKFVVNKEEIEKTQEEIEEILKDISPCEIYVMPMGQTTKQLKQNDQAIIDMAIKNGYIYSDRIHIRVWENKKGV